MRVARRFHLSSSTRALEIERLVRLRLSLIFHNLLAGAGRLLWGNRGRRCIPHEPRFEVCES